MRTIRNIIVAVVLFGLSCVNVSCDKDDDGTQSVTVIETTRVKSITYTSAVCVGYVVGSYSECGVCVSTAPITTLDGRIASSQSSSQFEIAVDKLSAGVKYYVRTYAICNGEVVFSPEKEFETVRDGDPLLEFSGAVKASYTTATIEGFVVATGGRSIEARGLCYAATPEPTIDNSNIEFEGGVGRMNADLKGLVDGKTYYGCVYVKIGGEYYYSPTESFNTVEYEKPVATITAIAEIATTSITIDANVATLNILPVTARGLIYGTTETVAEGKVIAAATVAAGDFTLKLEGLEQGSAYYVWAYADNLKGRSYSDKILVKTKSDLAQITLDTVADVVSRSGAAKVTITDLGLHSAAITEAGVCWSTSTKPTVADSRATVNSPAMGTFEGVKVRGLKPATKYYARAFVTNQYGTSYSAEQSFTTREDMYGTMLLVGIDGKTAPKFNGWQIIVKDVTSASATNVPESVLTPGFKSMYDNFTTAVDGYSGSFMNGVIYRLRPTTDGGVLLQMTLYYRSASTKGLTSTGWMNIELIRDAQTGTFRFGRHAAWSANVYKSNTDQNKAYLDVLVDYFVDHSFYFEWSTAEYEFGTSIDNTTGPVRMVPVDDPDNYWSFTTKNYTSSADTGALANPFN